MERDSVSKKFEIKATEDQRTGLENIVLTLIEYHTQSSDLRSFEQEEVLKKVEEEARNLQSIRVTQELEVFLTSTGPCRRIDIDLPGFLDELTISGQVPGAASIRLSDFAEAKARGISTACDHIFSLFAPELPFSFGKRKIPFIPWRIDLANQYLIKEIEDTDEVIYSLPTKFAGVTVDFSYKNDSKIPERSLFLRKE